MVPAMMPPPFPVKIFELAAGVFEMKPLWFFSALMLGKFIRFVVVSLIIMVYGPAIFHTMMRTVHHQGLMMVGVGIVVVLILVYVVRKVFDRRRGANFPVEEE